MSQILIEATLREFQESAVLLAAQRERVAQQVGKETAEAKLSRQVLATLEEWQSFQEAYLAGLMAAAISSTREG